MTQPSESSLALQTSPLAQALVQNQSAQDSVESSAAELAVISAVLKQEVPDDVQIGDVAQALQNSDDLESRIQETAQDLAEVNEVLAQEMDQRALLERELVNTRAALAREKSKTV